MRTRPLRLLCPGLFAMVCLTATTTVVAAPASEARTPLLLPDLVANVRTPIWHADTFRAVNGTYSAWCGSYDVESCVPGDPSGGYGRDYNEILEWRGRVADPAQPCTLSVSSVINIDTMFGYDYFFISVVTAAVPQYDLLYREALYNNLPLAAQFVYQPGEYVGANADEVVVRFRVTSDGGWDGDACLWPNDGAVQLDDVVISLSNGAGYSHDFEDGTLGDFQVAFPEGGYAAAPPAPAAVSVRAHPNPFHPTTNISYTVDRPGRLMITIYDLRGQLVRTILDGHVDGGGTVEWDGSRTGGLTVGAGVYFVAADFEGNVDVGKLVLVK